MSNSATCEGATQPPHLLRRRRRKRRPESKEEDFLPKPECVARGHVGRTGRNQTQTDREEKRGKPLL